MYPQICNITTSAHNPEGAQHCCALEERAYMEIEHLQQFSDTLTILPIRRVAQGARRRRSVDRNSFWSPRGACDSRSVQHRPPGSTSVRTAIIRYAPRAVGLMEIEKYIRSPARAVGLKPSALQGEARLRGTRTPTVTLSPLAARRSPTTSPRLCKAKPACAGYDGLFLQRPYEGEAHLPLRNGYCQMVGDALIVTD